MKSRLMKSLVIVMATSLSQIVLAATPDMNTDLVQLVDQLDAMLPLIAQAEKKQDHNAPVQFHFETWIDSQGTRHNGLKQDVIAMRAAIANQINAEAIAPRALPPLEQDYVQGNGH